MSIKLDNKAASRESTGVRSVRVLIVAPSFDIPGGMATQAANHERFLGREPSIDVAFIPVNPRLPGVLRLLQRVKYLRTVVTSIAFIAQLLIHIPRADVVHVFSAASTGFVISTTPPLLIARATGKVSILHYHSGQADPHLRRWRWTAPRTIRLVDAIVVPSEYLVAQFARHGFDTELIRNAIELDEFEYRAREPLRPVFLSNRQLLSHCNVACILRGFAEVQKVVSDARLIVAADGDERPKLERLAAELGLRGTDFIGWVAAEEMGGVYSRADIFLNTSAFDNIPISIVEAFASGLPVVSTDVAGVSELVRHGETGMLVAPDDHHQLAATALALLDDHALASRLARNALHECPQFTWPAVREQWLELYGRLGG